MYKGIDISNNNGSVDLGIMADNGVSVVIAKATEGNSFKDKYFNKNYTNAKANNQKFGAYHFFTGGSSPEEQAEAFWGMIKDYSLDILPVLDVETAFSDLNDKIQRFVATFKELSGLDMIIYTYTGFLRENLSTETFNCFKYYWEANYNNRPFSGLDTSVDKGSCILVGHQYTEKGIFPGINGVFDVNSFTPDILDAHETIPGEWILDDKGWWYKHKDGGYSKDSWECIKGKWYLFGIDGYMQYGWQSDCSNWYYMGKRDDGSMKTGWFFDSELGHWYYLNSDGVMVTGWLQYKNTWYYMNQNGSMATGWVKFGGKDYMMWSDGSMAHACESYGYSFADNGVATKLS